MEKVAIPILDDAIAPCFEVARLFMVCEINDRKQVDIKIENCSGCEGFSRIRFLEKQNIKTVICNGIKSFYKDMLLASGINVISNISLPANDALKNYLGNKLKITQNDTIPGSISNPIPLDDLQCWARDLFKSHGYSIIKTDSLSHSLIDFIAEIICPVCKKPVRVAVCCGAHSYDSTRELKHFHYSTSSNYQARVFVYTASQKLVETCREYDIELIDPAMDEELPDGNRGGKIPILRNPVEGHEKAFNVD